MYLTSQSASSAVTRPSGAYLFSSPLSRRRVRRGGLGALAPIDAAKQIFPNAPRSSSAGHNMATFNQMVAAAQAGQVVDASGGPAYVPGTGACAGASLLKPTVANTAGGIALSFVPAAFAAGPVVGAIVLAGAAIAKVFGFIFGHHAAAIRKEQSILCAAVPAANQSLQIIDQALSSGQVTPQQAMDAIDSLVSGFRSAVAPIIHGADPTVSGECNAACVMLSELRAVALVKKSQYQDLADSQAKAAANPVAAASSALEPIIGPVSSAVSKVSASTGIPTWLLYTAAGVLLKKVFFE